MDTDKEAVHQLEQARADENLKDDDVVDASTAEEEARVIKKLDWHLMPLIFVIYMFSVLDRSNLGNAYVAGLGNDIDVTGYRYNWLGTAFYISCKYKLPIQC